MDDRISDMHRDEERKAAELVEKACKNCDHIKINMDSAYCFDCTNHSNFRPTQSAIDAKIEELRVKGSTIKMMKAEQIIEFLGAVADFIDETHAIFISASAEDMKIRMEEFKNTATAIREFNKNFLNKCKEEVET